MRTIWYKAISTYVSIPFLKVVTSVAFSKCFVAFLIKILRFTLKILKKKNYFPKRLVSSKKFIFKNYGKYDVPAMDVRWSGTIFCSKCFLPSTHNRRSLEDKWTPNVFTTAFHKVSSKIYYTKLKICKYITSV